MCMSMWPRQLHQQELQFVQGTPKTYRGLFMDVVREPVCICDPDRYTSRNFSLCKGHPRPIVVYSWTWWGSLWVYVTQTDTPARLQLWDTHDASWSINRCGECVLCLHDTDGCQQELQLLQGTFKICHGLFIDVVREPVCCYVPESYVSRRFSFCKGHSRSVMVYL